MDWVLIIFGTQVIKKKRPVRPVFPNYLSVSYDYGFTNYADDTTPYVLANNTAEVIENLTIITQKLFTWFANNQMKVNHDKYHLLLSTRGEANIQIANTTIKCSKSKKLLGIVLDNKL